MTTEKRRAQQRASYLRKLAQETPEQREERLAKRRRAAMTEA